MTIHDIIWTKAVVDKIQSKHAVSPEEVEYALRHRPHLRYVERGNVEGEDLYQAWGRTPGGRYLLMYVILKPSIDAALPISARQMTQKEKRFYARQKKKKG